MPSPKAGTVSADPAASVAEFKVRRLQRATPQTATGQGRLGSGRAYGAGVRHRPQEQGCGRATLGVGSDGHSHAVPARPLTPSAPFSQRPPPPHALAPQNRVSY